MTLPRTSSQENRADSGPASSSLGRAAPIPTAPGTAQAWRPVPNHPCLEISESGFLRRTFKDGSVKPIAGRVDDYGYRVYETTVSAKRVKLKAHRVVCAVFNGSCPDGKPVVAHIDGNKENNHFTNLRWSSFAENANDHYGSPDWRPKNIKYGFDKIKSIRSMHNDGVSARKISEYLEIDVSYIRKIVKNKVRRNG